MISFRFFNMEQQDDEVANAMRQKEKQFLRSGDDGARSLIESEYTKLEAWFGGDTTRLNAAVSRVSGR